MKSIKFTGLIFFMIYQIAFFSLYGQEATKSEWISLFDGKTFNGWKANLNKEVFSISNGAIIARGGRCHLFYMGNDGKASYGNFELKADVMTEKGTNSGIYVHTQYQEEGWPKSGYEIQINNSGNDKQKTGSIYNIAPDTIPRVGDKQWFNMHIIVNNQNIIVKVNNKTVVDYTEKDLDKPIHLFPAGTVALQGHSDGSVVYFKNIYIKPLK